MYRLLRRLLFLLPPEAAHRLATFALDLAAPLLRRPPPPAPVLALGLHFPNPVGLAAGFDKNAEHLRGLAGLGFGFLEVGSVTLRPWPGNARPRLFRLPADGALINRMGLNNHGALAVAERLAQRRPGVPVFVNVAKTPDPALEGAAAIDDYVQSFRILAPHADALVLNISCPNSGDGRTFEDPDALAALLDAVVPERGGRPLLVKLSPDLSPEALESVVRIALARGVDGFTATNTTVARTGLHTPEATLKSIGRGGLSGAPLRLRSLEVVRRVRALTDRPIVAVGGIQTAEHAREALAAGATLVQLYTGFVYGGPGTARRIARDLGRGLARGSAG